MARDVEPLVASLGHALGEAKRRADHVHLCHADRLAAAQRRGAVVRIVQILQDHDEAAEARRGHAIDLVAALVAEVRPEGVDHQLGIHAAFVL